MVRVQAMGKWRPTRGLAEKLRRFASENGQALARIRSRSKRGGALGSRRASKETGTGRCAPTALGHTDSLHAQLSALAAAQQQLATRVDANQQRLEERIEQLATLLRAGAPGATSIRTVPSHPLEHAPDAMNEVAKLQL